MQLPVCGGMPPYSWAVVVGSLPTGLTLQSKGWITGTPSSTGMCNFTAMVTDAAGNTAAGSFSLDVDKIPNIATTTPTSDSSLSQTQQMWASGKRVDFIVNYPIDILDLAKDQYVAITPMVLGNKIPWSFIAIGLPKGLICDPVTGTHPGPGYRFCRR